jgi:uncharacterized Tic20 family protein
MISLYWTFGLYAVGTLLHIISMVVVWFGWFIIGRDITYAERFFRRTANFQCSILLYLIGTIGLLSRAGTFLSDRVDIWIVNSLNLSAMLLLAVLLYLSFGLVFVGSISAMFGEIISYPLTIKFISEEV